MKYDLLLIDLDGTLIDSLSDIVTATNQTLIALHHSPRTREEIATYIGSGMTELLRGALNEPSDEHVKTAVSLFRQYYQKVCDSSSTFYPTVADTLQVLHKKIPMAVLTNKPRIYTDQILKNLKYDQFFLDVVCCGDEAPKKPDPTGANNLIKKFKVTPQKTLMIGDSRIDCQTASNANMAMALAAYGFGNHGDFSDLKIDYRLEQFSDLLKIVL